MKKYISKHALELLMVVSMMCAGIVVATQPATETVYARYTVQPGDTVWAIAGQYADRQTRPFNEFVYSIQAENKLAGRYIQPGDEIVIPMVVVK